MMTILFSIGRQWTNEWTFVKKNQSSSISSALKNKRLRSAETNGSKRDSNQK